MATEGIHYLALSHAKKRFAKVTADFAVAKQQLSEAVALGDLRENSEYEAAKDSVGKLARELDALQPVMSMTSVRASDSLLVIQEGCVLDLIIHRLTDYPVAPGTEAFEELMAETPEFRGLLAYGASMQFHELLVDNILSVRTPVGAFILGKQPGSYSIEVPGGFSNVTVLKAYNIENPDQLYCAFNGERHVEE